MDIETSSAIKLFFPNPSLVQVFHEALANSLDAGAHEISIRVEIQSYSRPETLKLVVSDNGEGFTKESFERFRRLLKPQDSYHKGLGRLVYLRYFERVRVESVWDDQRRTFVFSEEFNGTSDVIKLEGATERLTSLEFTGFKGERIKSYDYLKPGALKAEIIERFLPKFHEFQRKQRGFTIQIKMVTEESNVQKDFFSSDEIITEQDLPELTTVKIKDHTLDLYDDIEMAFQVRSDSGKNSQNIIAVNIDGRTIPINLIQPTSIPIGHSIIFLFSSKWFDAKSDTSRQKLLLPDTISEVDLFRVLRREVGNILSQKIPLIGERNNDTTKQFEKKFPHLLGYFESTTVGLIDYDDALNIAQQKFFHSQKKVLLCENLDETTYEASLELSSRVLTEYILYREKIIRRMREMTKDNSEAEIHNLIVPRYDEFSQEDFAEGFYRNNAWLLDDKFMSFQTILSEARLSEVIKAIRLDEETVVEGGRPDIAMIFSDDPEKVTQVDVVVVEIKKKTDDTKENIYAIDQLLDRAQKLINYCSNIQRVWYYAVLQVNEVLAGRLQQMKWAPLFSKGKVFYQDFETRRKDGAIVLTPTFVLSFDAIISDAECRNHTFLEILRKSMKYHSEKKC